MDTNNQSSSGYILDIMKKKGRKIAAAVLGLEEQVTEEPIETEGSPTALWGSFSDTFSPEEYDAERQLNNIQTRAQSIADTTSRMYRNVVPKLPQNIIDQSDVQEMHSDVPQNLPDSEVTRRPKEENKKRQKKWLWTCIGLSVVIGASVIAYSYAEDRNEHHSKVRNSSSWLVNQHIRGGRFESTAEILINNSRFKSLIFSSFFACFVRSKVRLM